MPALTLWIVWRLSADYLDIEKRVIGLALLTLIPFFNFHALKFNVNTVLMPLWAATIWWFLRSVRTRSALYAALAGLAAGGAMLGKYWSVFLLAGLALAALIDNRRAIYFRSAAPWITIIAGAIVLAPHVIWLVRNDFAPFGFRFPIGLRACGRRSHQFCQAKRRKIEIRGKNRATSGRSGSWRNCHQLYVSEPGRTVSDRGAVRASGTFEARTRNLPSADRRWSQDRRRPGGCCS